MENSGVEAKVICDSVALNGARLTTFQLKAHRMILAEFNTHRAFSRNASSSRAIPVHRMIQQIREDPAMPVYWGKNKPGMQAREELVGEELADAKRNWLLARDWNASYVEDILVGINGLHKQLANRLLEPWMWSHIVVTSTDWQNFFNLRCNEDAQPEIHVLALAMRSAYVASHPRSRGLKEWHLPYIFPEEIEEHGYDSLDLRKASVGRCARVSYNMHDGSNCIISKDIGLHDDLLLSGHMSPFEHPAIPTNAYPTYHVGNFYGWKQYRKFLPNESIFQG